MAGVYHWQRHSAQARCRRYIERYVFPVMIVEKLQRRYPQLNETQILMIFKCLHDHFLLCLTARGQPVAMPSQGVDQAWHEFI